MKTDKTHNNDNHHDHSHACSANCHCHDTHDTGCSCCNDGHSHEHLNTKTEWIKIAISGVLLIFGAIVLHYPDMDRYLTIAGLIAVFSAYILCGYDTVIESVKSLFSGSFSAIFNENLLMTVATVCAVIIGEYTEAAAVMVLFKLGELLQSIAVGRSRRGIESALSFCADTARVLYDDDTERIVSPEEVSIGSNILVKPGERIALDGSMLCDGVIDYQAITGESVPVTVRSGETALSGGIVISKPVTISVSALFHDSTAARIMRTVESAKEGKPRLESFIRRFSRYYTPAVMLLAFLVAAIPSLFGWGSESGLTAADWIEKGLLFLVVSCPCALVISVPLTFFSGLSRGAREGVLFKSADMIESLSRVRTMAFDKTGTLTMGTFVVSKCVPYGDISADDIILIAGALEANSIHPIAQAIYRAAKNTEDGFSCNIEGYIEEPGLGVRATIDSHMVAVGSMDYMEHLNVSHTASSASSNADTVGTTVYVARDNMLIGEIHVGDVIRSDSAQTVEYMNTHNINTALLTGDSEKSAKMVASELQIRDIHYGLLPEDKLNVLDSLRKKYGPVAFVGDGTNDAPVLAGSNVGLVMGAMGTDAAIESGDVLIMGDCLYTVSKAMRLSKKIMLTARFNIALALAIKILAMLLGVLGMLEMWMAVIADVGVTLICVMIATFAFSGGERIDNQHLNTKPVCDVIS